MMKKVLLPLILFFSSLFSVDKVIYPNVDFPVEAPWLTGPLLAPSSVTVPPGSYNIEPFFSAQAFTGTYNEDWKAVKSNTFWANSLQIPIQVGVFSWMDVEIVPSFAWNYTEHRGKWVFQDFPVLIDIQLYNNKFSANNWMPSIKLVLREIFPTGQYDQLDSDNLETDAGGFGSWISGIGIVFGKLTHLKGPHFLNARLTIQYDLPSATQLRGLNFYGGGEGTRARYFPGQNFFIDLGMELTLTQNWALAIDLVAAYFKRAHFSGFPGFNPDGSLATLRTASKTQYSIAPAIEYNWSANWGVIGGAWLTVAGRNSLQFFSGVIAVNYYH